MQVCCSRTPVRINVARSIETAGKSTVSKAVAARINALCAPKAKVHSETAIDVPMDGYHYTREHLKTMPNPEVAIHRRGAAFTYDAEGFCNLVRALREPTDTLSSFNIFAPSFDHATKDPVESAIQIPATTRIVILEGNYISLDVEPWRSAAHLMDERWFVEVDEDVARERLAARHVSSRIVPNLSAAYARIDSTDCLNAIEILTKRMEVDLMLLF